MLLLVLFTLILPLMTAVVTLLAIKRVPMLNRLKKAALGEGLKMLDMGSMFSSRQTVRCAAGNQVISFSFGKFDGKETMECLVPANPSVNSFPAFAIYSLFRRDLAIPQGRSAEFTWLNPANTDIAACDTNALLETFSVHSSDLQRFFRLMSPEISIKLKQLKGLFRNDSLMVVSDRNVIRIVKPSSYKNSEKNLTSFFNLAIDLVSLLFETTGSRLMLERPEAQRLLTAKPSLRSSRSTLSGVPIDAVHSSVATGRDIQLIESSSASDEEKICQICGDIISTHYVICVKCETLYHKDCWTYNGRCATFGCLSTHFREI
jgi:hypothetical protein